MTEQQAVTFRPVDRGNFIDLVKLSVHESQRRFVASNVFSIAESKVEPDWVPLGIYAGEVPVGFAMYGYDRVKSQWIIYRLMIGAEYQRKGHGKAAMRKLIREMLNDHGMETILLSYDLGNDAAARFYSDLGFRETGEVEDGEIVAELRPNEAGDV